MTRCMNSDGARRCASLFRSAAASAPSAQRNTSASANRSPGERHDWHRPHRRSARLRQTGGREPQNEAEAATSALQIR